MPAYTLIVREYLPAREAGGKIGFVLMATIFGMAFGGWISGWIYDATGSYEFAFLNGIAFNGAEHRDHAADPVPLAPAPGQAGRGLSASGLHRCSSAAARLLSRDRTQVSPAQITSSSITQIDG